ncbi:MAG: hypothetical protein AAFW98_14240, partial [Pseudomonadota bacterium]
MGDTGALGSTFKGSPKPVAANGALAKGLTGPHGHSQWRAMTRPILYLDISRLVRRYEHFGGP